MNVQVLGAFGHGERGADPNVALCILRTQLVTPHPHPRGPIFSLLVDIIWVKKNLGLGITQQSLIGINFFRCC